MKHTGQNGPCTCGSGLKYKKCCGTRGGLTPLEYAEEQAYKEERTRNKVLQAKDGLGSKMPFLTYFAAMANPYINSGRMPRPPINHRSKRTS